jgi:hypothetical protein
MTPHAVRVQWNETTSDGAKPNLHATCETFTHTISLDMIKSAFDDAL